MQERIARILMTKYAGDKLEGSVKAYAKIEEAIRGEALIYIRKQININKVKTKYRLNLNHMTSFFHQITV